MATCYKETPLNFQDIEPYVIQDKEQIVRKIITAQRCYFYDTCSFRRHAHLPNPQYWFDYIKNDNGIVIITRCILMELASHSGILNSEYIDYIKEMNTSGVEILVIYEENLFDILSVCFSANECINNFLHYTVRNVKTATGTISETLKNDVLLKQEILVKENVSDGSLFTRFFKEVRSNKESGDNLGEELLVVCVHMLSNIPENFKYKYIIVTDDKGAIGLVKKAMKNADELQKPHLFSAFTTTRIAQLLYTDRLISQKAQVEEILSVCVSDGKVPFLGTEEYDLEIKEKKMTCDELAQKIMTENAVRIHY